MKRYLIIGLIVILGIGLFVLGYFLRKDGDEPLPNGDDQKLPPTSTSTPIVTPGKINPLKLESLGFEVRGFFAGEDGGVVIVLPTGHITSIKDGKNSLVSETAIAEIVHSSFSYNGKKVLVGFGGWDNPQFSVFDLEKKSWQPLVPGVTAAAWNENDLRLVYALKKDGYTSLSVVDFGVSKPTGREITRVHAEDLVLVWSGKDEVIFYNKGSSFIPSSAWKINVSTKKLTPLFSNKTSFGIKADSIGANILALFDQGSLLSLSLFNKQGGLLRELAFKTLPEKCDFATEKTTAKATSTKSNQAEEKTFLYCAAPGNFDLVTGKLLLEDYTKKKVFSLDNFFKLDTGTGSFVRVYEGKESLDAAQVEVVGKKIYFINRYDDKLYSISL